MLSNHITAIHADLIALPFIHIVTPLELHPAYLDIRSAIPSAYDDDPDHPDAIMIRASIDAELRDINDYPTR